MAEKILITGKNKLLIKDMVQRLPNDLVVKKCGVKNHEIKRMLESFTPSLILVCLDREENGELMLFDLYFKQDKKLSEVPIIAAGSKEDCERFASYVHDQTTMYRKRPLSYDKVYQAIREKLNTQKDSVHNEETAKKEEVDANKKIVLLVDDDIMLLKTVQSQLAGKYRVAVAVSGAAAIRYLEKHSCDIILLDYLMPEEDGPMVLKKIREMPGGSEIPVIFLTSVKQAERVKHCLALRPQGYVLKPVKIQNLIQRIEQVLFQGGSA